MLKVLQQIFVPCIQTAAANSSCCWWSQDFTKIFCSSFIACILSIIVPLELAHNKQIGNALGARQSDSSNIHCFIRWWWICCVNSCVASAVEITFRVTSFPLEWPIRLHCTPKGRLRRKHWSIGSLFCCRNNKHVTDMLQCKNDIY